jgi:outer membrane protein OmpA-like peptidoglycan-associated protein
MGQEVIYLLLTFSLLCNVLLIHFLTAEQKKIAALTPANGNFETLLTEYDKLKRNYGSLKIEFDRIKKLNNESTGLRTTYESLKRDYGLLKVEFDRSKKPNDQPPIITLTEAKGYRFATGSAELTREFFDLLKQEIVPRLVNDATKYDATIVEIVGHTDGAGVGDSFKKRGPNLDDALGAYATGTEGLGPDSAPIPDVGARGLVPYDNVGLGMSRAVAVARALRAAGLPDYIHVHPLSAAYLIAPDDTLSPAPRSDDSTRRRIEIRLRRTGSSRNN